MLYTLFIDDKDYKFVVLGEGKNLICLPNDLKNRSEQSKRFLFLLNTVFIKYLVFINYLVDIIY